ncbi:MAG: hypothetical protein ACD_63C00026G0005 [uncultured bacterium]|nr:MAG: hypothetical protein ACD_63C00026G0005 [uncultured bacterium]
MIFGGSKKAAEAPAVEGVSSSEVENVMGAYSAAKNVLSSDKFLTLSTYGKVPVTVSEDEMGKEDPFKS